MRTTITLTPEADALVREAMRERGLSFTDAVNAAIVGRQTPRGVPRPFETPVFDLGGVLVPLEHPLTLTADLENEELHRKRDLRA